MLNKSLRYIGRKRVMISFTPDVYFCNKPKTKSDILELRSIYFSDDERGDFMGTGELKYCFQDTIAFSNSAKLKVQQKRLSNPVKFIWKDLHHDSLDGSHPTSEGMNTLAMIGIKEMAGEKVNRFLDFKSSGTYLD